MDHSFLTRLVDLLDRRVPVALCTVVGAVGSTPQDAGAKMAVLPDLDILGTIGGGCVEAEVRRRAVRLLEQGRNEVMHFRLDSDYGWDDGLICGGSLTVLVESLRDGRWADLFRRVRDGRSARRGLVLATVVRRGGECPADRYVFEPGDPVPGAIAGLVGAEESSAAVEKAVRRARPASVRRDPAGRGVVGRGSAAEDSVADEVFFEPVLPRKRLVIAGAGHVGQALAGIAAMLEFEVWVIDDRDTYASADRFPQADRLLIGDIPRTLAGLDIDADTYVVVVTRGHKHDCDALYAVVRRPAGYLGLIGSRRKIGLIFDNFRAAGVTEEQISAVHAPIGLDIGSRTVAEIAVSIAAELVQVRSRGGAAPPSPTLPQTPGGPTAS
jgi:xanthine dehydrogenase accessory factor